MKPNVAYENNEWHKSKDNGLKKALRCDKLLLMNFWSNTIKKAAKANNKMQNFSFGGRTALEIWRDFWDFMEILSSRSFLSRDFSQQATGNVGYVSSLK